MSTPHVPHVPDVPHVPNVARPGTEPHLTPWWTWLVLAVMSVGAILAAAVLSRQSGHIAANKETAADVQAISDEVKDVKSEVHYLRAFVDVVKADADATAERIEAVQEQASERAEGGDVRQDNTNP
jgi:uncharacterized protein YlxW (UPF0749 family)